MHKKKNDDSRTHIPGLDIPWVAVGAAAACPGLGSVPGPVEVPLTPAAVAAVGLVEKESAVVGPVVAAAAAELEPAAVVELVPAAAAAETEKTGNSWCQKGVPFKIFYV